MKLYISLDSFNLYVSLIFLIILCLITKSINSDGEYNDFLDDDPFDKKS